MVRVILLLLCAAWASRGQNYNFSIPEFSCSVEVNRDRSLNISYDILFECSEGYSPVDIIDIGFPSEDFQLQDIQASIDGHTLRGIYHSTYIDNGVEVHLREHSIMSGDSGRFRLTGINRDMVFLDTAEDDYASMEFSPTWFEGGLLSGESDFTLTVVFPPGADPRNARYHDIPFTSSHTNSDGRFVYQWRERRRVDSPYQAGVSFPAGLVEGPLSERPREPFISREALTVILAFGIMFLVFGVMIFVIVKAVIKSRKRMEEYLPPKLGLEGSGVRRGLTAPMAALLLETKLDRVLTLIVFGLLKKGELQLDGNRLKRAGSVVGLRSYEKELMELIPPEGRDKPIPREDMKRIFLGMIEELEKKMENYSLRETREYYRSIIESAWRMASADNSAGKAGEILGDRFQWMLADENFSERVGSLPEGRSALLPVYMRGFMGSGGKSASAGGIGLGEACSQLAGVVESAAGRTVSRISSLSRIVTAKTNPVPVSSRSSSGGSCACACAGCACACAGGGR